MFLNLSEVLQKENKVFSTQADAELEEVQIAGERYPVVSHSPVSFTFTNLEKGKLRLEGHAEYEFRIACARCLKPVATKLSLSFERELYAPDRLSEIPEESLDQDFLHDYQMDVEELLDNEIVINWPMKVLCRSDCKGICRQCGMDLNTGTCDCDTFVPDPRMAVIKDIFNANKEV